MNRAWAIAWRVGGCRSGGDVDFFSCLSGGGVVVVGETSESVGEFHRNVNVGGDTALHKGK